MFGPFEHVPLRMESSHSATKDSIHNGITERLYGRQLERKSTDLRVEACTTGESVANTASETRPRVEGIGPCRNLGPFPKEVTEVSALRAIWREIAYVSFGKYAQRCAQTPRVPTNQSDVLVVPFPQWLTANQPILAKP